MRGWYPYLQFFLALHIKILRFTWWHRLSKVLLRKMTRAEIWTQNYMTPRPWGSRIREDFEFYNIWIWSGLPVQHTCQYMVTENWMTQLQAGGLTGQCLAGGLQKDEACMLPGAPFLPQNTQGQEAPDPFHYGFLDLRPCPDVNQQLLVMMAEFGAQIYIMMIINGLCTPTAFSIFKVLCEH